MSTNQVDNLIIEKCPYHDNCEFINNTGILKKILQNIDNSINKRKLLDFLFNHRTDLKLEKMYIGDSNLRLYQMYDKELTLGKFYFLKPENAVLVDIYQFNGNDKHHFFLNENFLTINPDSMEARLYFGEFCSFLAKIIHYRKNVYLLRKQVEDANKKLVMNFSVFKIPEKHEPTSLFNISADNINDQKYSNELFKKFTKRMLL